MDTTYRTAMTITISRSKLFNDINALTYAFSEVGGASDNLRRSDRIAVDTSATLDEHIMTRLCDHRAQDVRQMFVKYIAVNTSAVTHTASDTKSNGTYTYSLVMPNDADDSILEPMADLIHDYIVNGALADWYAKIGSGNTELLNLRAKEDLARLKELIYYRPMP